MEPLTIFLFAAAFGALYLGNIAWSVHNLAFYPGNVTNLGFDSGSPEASAELIVQNTSNAQITIYSLTASVTLNGDMVGNIYNFTPVNINPNSQTAIPITIRFLMLGVISQLIDTLNAGLHPETLVISGSCNANGVQVPLPTLTYQLG